MEKRYWFVLTAEKGGETTRFAVGCIDQSISVLQALERGGYTTEVKVAAKPIRDKAEELRATRILGELFGN